MNIKIGTLTCVPALEHPELMSPSVAAALAILPGADNIGVVEIDPVASDTAAFCSTYQINRDQVSNCVILEAKRGERTWFAACAILSNTRADVNGLARRILDARKVSFAQMQKAVKESGMEYGAITSVGLPTSWSVLVDKAVTDAPLVVIGSGIRKSKLVVAGSFFTLLPNVQILEGLGKAVESED
jgi:prolyl-tRNA editing enzyme YbaK/EbsC (Cys-tRNA(Pro) deacylase)